MSSKQVPDHVSVSDFLETLNDGLKNFDARVLGEVTEVQLYPGRSYLFFKVKDKDDQAVMTCFMWRRDYELSGVELEAGLEVIVSGYPEIYKPNGRFALQTKTVEHVGEGKLKKAYDELKARLDKEGIFSPDRKRPLPVLPQKIGLITSKDGAAIGDFQVNLGGFGFKVLFVDSRVEGQLAVPELLGAIRTMRKHNSEVLVLVRGGGSLESLLAFNNEALVREVAAFPVPVLVGVGHEKDVPLIALAADTMVSTPTAAAQALNESWQEAANVVLLNQQKMLSMFAQSLQTHRSSVEESFHVVRDHFQSIITDFKKAENSFLRSSTAVRARISELRRYVGQYPVVLVRGMSDLIEEAGNRVADTLNTPVEKLASVLRNSRSMVGSIEKLLESHNPERQLKLGYSIVHSQGAIVRRINQVRKGQNIEVRVQDGSFDSEITNIKKNV